MNDNIRRVVAMLATWSVVSEKLKHGAKINNEIFEDYAQYTVEGLSGLALSLCEAFNVDAKDLHKEIDEAIRSYLEAERQNVTH
jgi:hypothetical protein